MKRIKIAAATALVLIATVGGLFASGVFTGGGSGNPAVAASQGQDGVLPSQSADSESTLQENDQGAWLGAQIVETPDGPAVAGVYADSPADKAGLKRGDVIKSIDGTSVSNVRAVRDALADKNPGDTVTVSITRDGNAQDVTVTLEARPEPLPQAYPVFSELNGIPRDELFSHLLGGSFQFTDKDDKTHTVSVELGTVTSADANAKTVSVDLNSGGSKQYSISDDVITMPSDLTQFADGDHVTVISVDDQLRALTKGPGAGFPFFGGRHGRGPGGGPGFPGEGGFEVPRGTGGLRF